MQQCWHAWLSSTQSSKHWRCKTKRTETKCNCSASKRNRRCRTLTSHQTPQYSIQLEIINITMIHSVFQAQDIILRNALQLIEWDELGQSKDFHWDLTRARQDSETYWQLPISDQLTSKQRRKTYWKDSQLLLAMTSLTLYQFKLDLLSSMINVFHAQEQLLRQCNYLRWRAYRITRAQSTIDRTN